jgi:hypothetical protein
VNDLGATLAELVRTAVREELRAALDELVPRETGPRLLDVDGCCAMLGCSRAKLHRLRTDGLPTIMVGDSPRFVADDVISWLRAR